MMADITRPKNLNPCRRHRTYPRMVKRTRPSNYLMKKPGDTGTRHHGPPTIKLISHAPPATAA
jgi:hypothetical protein